MRTFAGLSATVIVVAFSLENGCSGTSDVVIGKPEVGGSRAGGGEGGQAPASTGGQQQEAIGGYATDRGGGSGTGMPTDAESSGGFAGTGGQPDTLGPDAAIHDAGADASVSGGGGGSGGRTSDGSAETARGGASGLDSGGAGHSSSEGGGTHAGGAANPGEAGGGAGGNSQQVGIGGNGGAGQETGDGGARDSEADQTADVAVEGSTARVLCSFDYETADAGYGNPLCDWEVSTTGGSGGTVSAAIDDAIGSQAPGSLRFRTNFGAPDRLEVRVRSSESSAVDWSGMATLRAKIKVVIAGSLRTVQLGVANRANTNRSFNRSYSVSDLGVGQWSDISYDLSAPEQSVPLHEISRILLQLTAAPGAPGAPVANATVLVDDVRVE